MKKDPCRVARELGDLLASGLVLCELLESVVDSGAKSVPKAEASAAIEDYQRAASTILLP